MAHDIEWSFVLFQMLTGFISIGFYARRKNRSFLGWGLFGAMSLPIALICLLWAARRCTSCRAELPRGRSGICELCEEQQEQAAFTPAAADPATARA